MILQTKSEPFGDFSYFLFFVYSTPKSCLSERTRRLYKYSSYYPKQLPLTKKGLDDEDDGEEWSPCITLSVNLKTKVSGNFKSKTPVFNLPIDLNSDYWVESPWLLL